MPEIKITKADLAKLPRNRNVLISRQLRGMTAIQVKCVLKGEITNPVLVKKVAKGIKKVIKQQSSLPNFKKMKAA